eukprot:m.546800 g.546800  ORF g.546800 m.546800 type:complete len:512 (+) comp22155_c0_seq30:2497-4032(+)
MIMWWTQKPIVLHLVYTIPSTSVLHDHTCVPYTNCDASWTYETVMPTTTSDRACATFSPCHRGEYYVPAVYSDVHLLRSPACATCPPGYYQLNDAHFEPTCQPHIADCSGTYGYARVSVTEVRPDRPSSDYCDIATKPLGYAYTGRTKYGIPMFTRKSRLNLELLCLVRHTTRNPVLHASLRRRRSHRWFTKNVPLNHVSRSACPVFASAHLARSKPVALVPRQCSLRRQYSVRGQAFAHAIIVNCNRRGVDKRDKSRAHRLRNRARQQQLIRSRARRRQVTPNAHLPEKTEELIIISTISLAQRNATLMLKLRYHLCLLCGRHPLNTRHCAFPCTAPGLLLMLPMRRHQLHGCRQPLELREVPYHTEAQLPSASLSALSILPSVGARSALLVPRSVSNLWRTATVPAVCMACRATALVSPWDTTRLIRLITARRISSRWCDAAIMSQSPAAMPLCVSRCSRLCRMLGKRGLKCDSRDMLTSPNMHAVTSDSRRRTSWTTTTALMSSKSSP